MNSVSTPPEGKRIAIAAASAEEREHFINAYLNEFELALDRGDTVIMKRRKLPRSEERKASERRWGWFAILFSFLGQQPIQTSGGSQQSGSSSRSPQVPHDVEYIELTVKAGRTE
jgi:hypothetical protein